MTFPGPRSPALPKLGLRCPAGWVEIAAPGAVLAVAQRKRGDAFRANVTVAVERVVAGTKLEDIVAASDERTRAAFPDLELGAHRRGPIAGQRATVVEQAFTHPEAGTLFQLRALFLAPKVVAQVRDLVAVHATCAGADAARDGVLLYEVLGTLTCR